MCDCALGFFFNDTATTEIYTLSLHDALPICRRWEDRSVQFDVERTTVLGRPALSVRGELDLATAPRLAEAAESQLSDRKSTRLNSSHANISYAVFCLKKKNKSFSHTSPLCSS